MTGVRTDAGGHAVQWQVRFASREYDHLDASGLVNALYEEQVARYGYADPAGADPGEYRRPHGLFLVAYSDGLPVGCGGYRTFDVQARCAEVKKMFVRPECRGRGIGREVLRRLEDQAEASGFRSVILETGIRNEAALALYGAMGYQPRPRYAIAYRDPSINRAFTKDLTAPDAGPTPLGAASPVRG